MYQALYRKWRPLKFVDVIGQKHITDTLRNQIETRRLSHAYLFSGTRGTGKTTCAKILSRAVNCENPLNGDPCCVCSSCKSILEGSVLDVVEIDAASNNGVDNIRDIRDETSYMPTSVKKRVYIIDEVHMLSTGAFNALLKTLEEPPSHVIFILATTDVHKVPATILSRCQRFDFRRITQIDISNKLIEVAKEENINITKNAANLIARLSDGAMRDALSILDRMAECDVIDEQEINRCVGILDSSNIIQLVNFIEHKDIANAVMLISEAYSSGRNLLGVFDQFLAIIRDILLLKTSKQDVCHMISNAYDIEQIKTFVNTLDCSTLVAWSNILQESQSRLKYALNRRIEAELTIIRMCNISKKAYDTIEGRLEALEQNFKNITLSEKFYTHSNSIQNDIKKPKEISQKRDNYKEIHKTQKSEEKQVKEMQDWKSWKDFIKLVTGKINMGALTCMKAGYVKPEICDDILFFICDDDVTAELLKNETTKSKIKQAVAQIENRVLDIRICEPDKNIKRKQLDDNNINEILKKAKDLNIEIKEF